MPDILVLSRQTEDCLRLQAAAKQHGYRVKTTTEISIAREWIDLKCFEVLFLESSFSEKEQKELADLAWSQQPLATVVCFNLDARSPYPGPSRLFGAEVAYGKDALSQIEEILVMASSRSGRPAARGAGSFRILVVEDLDAPRDIICSYLESMGFPEVRSVASAEEALRLCEADPDGFSCVVTDIRMPNIDGRELISVLRRHDKLRGLPIVVLTSFGTADCLVDCLKAGASGFLVKPPKKVDLKRELERAQRIAAGHASPRLATPHEAELLRDEIEARMQKSW